MSDRRPEDSFDPPLIAGIASALQAAPPNASQRAGMRARVLERIRQKAPAGTVMQRASEAEWIAQGDLIRIRVLREDCEAGNHTLLIRMRAGAQIPGHSHTQEEECLVLDGEIEIDTHVLAAGDMLVTSPGASHGQILCRRDALLLVRSEIPPYGAALA